MKLLFINQHFGAESAATGVLLKQLATGLVKRQHQVKVITGADGRLLRGVTVKSEEEGVQVHRVQDAAIGNKSTLRRLWHYASYFGLAAWVGLRSERPDAVVAMSTPPLLAPFLSRILAWYHHVPFFYNVQDLYPDVALASGHVPAWIEKVLLRFTAWLEAGASGTSTVGRTMARRLARRHKKPIVYLSNWADTREICPLGPQHSFRQLWGLNDKFTVLYSGNLGVCHDVATLVEMIELMRNQPVEFVFVINEFARRDLEQRIGQNPHVHFKPFQPREALSAVLATADVGLISLGRGMSRFVVPCKTYGIMAAGRPLLAVSDLQDDLYRLVHESKGGVWAPAGNAPAIARAILSLQQNAIRRAGMGRSARQYVEREHSLEVALSAWLDWLSGDEGREPKTIERRMAA